MGFVFVIQCRWLTIRILRGCTVRLFVIRDDGRPFGTLERRVAIVCGYTVRRLDRRRFAAQIEYVVILQRALI